MRSDPQGRPRQAWQVPCPACGVYNDDDWKRCWSCDAPLTEEQDEIDADC